MTSTTPVTCRSESDYLRHELRQSKSAIGGSVARMSSIVRNSNPLGVVRRHPILFGVGVAGISLLTAVVLIKSRSGRHGEPAGQPAARPRKRSWIIRLTRFSIKLIVNNALSYVLAPSTEPQAGASQHGDNSCEAVA